MSKVAIDMSMSLDGFIAGPNDTPEEGLGKGGEKLHEWLSDPETVEKVSGDLAKTTGAVIMGRRTYDNSIKWWGDQGPVGDVPCFVLTKKGTEPESFSKVFTFVTDGIESALELAKKAAGGKDIGITSAHTIQEYLKAGLVDEINIHLIPILLGGGRSLFGELGKFIELEKISVKDGSGVTHLTYEVKK